MSALGGCRKWDTDLISGLFLGKVYTMDSEKHRREMRAATSVARVR